MVLAKSSLLFLRWKILIGFSKTLTEELLLIGKDPILIDAIELSLIELAIEVLSVMVITYVVFNGSYFECWYFCSISN